MDHQDKVKLAKFRRIIKDSGNELINLVEIEDEILLRYVRRSHWNLEKSLQLLIRSCEARFSLPFSALVEKGCPNAVRHVFDKQIFGVLKQRDQLGRKVVWFRLSEFKRKAFDYKKMQSSIQKRCHLWENTRNIIVCLDRWDPNQLHENDLFIAIFLLAWELLASKTTQLKGVVGVLDVSDCTLAHLKVATLTKIKMYIKLYMECNPFRIGGGHIMFASMTFNIAFPLLKLLFPQKFHKLVHVHHSKKSLHEFIPAKSLPNFFGGLLTEREATDYAVIESLLEKDDYYKKLMKLGTEEFYNRFPKKEE